MKWERILKRAKTWPCGCAVDYEGFDGDLVHYPCKKYERDEICDFAIETYKDRPRQVEAYYNRTGKQEKLAELKRRFG